MTNNTTLWEVFTFAFKWWIFIFIAFVIPLDFLYRAGALLASLSPWQLAQNFSFLVIFFAVLSLGLASISLIFTLLSAKISSHGAGSVRKANLICGIAFALIIFIDYFWRWIQVTFSIQSFVKTDKMFLLVALFLLILVTISMAILYKSIIRTNDKIKSIVKASYRIIACVLSLSVITSLTLSLFNYYNYRESRPLIISEKSDHPKTSPNIIIVTFDALAARYTSLYGNRLKTTPNLDKLGQESYVFDHMYASSNWTLPSLASLMTGKYPNHHQINHAMSNFGAEQRKDNLPSILKTLGYETAVVWSNLYSCPWETNLAGFDLIFPENVVKKFLVESGLGPTTWFNYLRRESSLHKVFLTAVDLWRYRPDQILTLQRSGYSFARASEFITKATKPFFLWVHVLPPHAPYLASHKFLYTILPEKVFDTKDSYNRPLLYSQADQPEIDKLLMRYEETIMDVDHEFGKFLAYLEKEDIFNNTILIVSSDHGEMFERGFWSHGGPYLYEPLIHVPLIVHLPGQTLGKRIESNVNTVDLAPSILDFLGMEQPAWMDGQSIKLPLKDDNFDTRVTFSMQISYLGDSRDHDCFTKTVAAIKGNYELIKYIDLNRYEKYDVRNDRILPDDLEPTQQEIFSGLQKEIERVLAK